MTTHAALIEKARKRLAALRGDAIVGVKRAVQPAPPRYPHLCAPTRSSGPGVDIDAVHKRFDSAGKAKA